MSPYTRQYSTYDECETACIEWSRNHSGCFYVSTVDRGCYEIATLSEYDGEPYYRNGDLIYPDEWME